MDEARRDRPGEAIVIEVELLERGDGAECVGDGSRERVDGYTEPNEPNQPGERTRDAAVEGVAREVEGLEIREGPRGGSETAGVSSAIESKLGDPRRVGYRVDTVTAESAGEAVTE